MRTSRRFALAASLLATLGSCGVLGIGGPDRRTLLVQHFPDECVAVAIGLCMQIREPSEPDFTRHYGGIEGFTYQLGFEYEIEVEDHRVDNPPADGSSRRTVLLEIVSQQQVPAGTEFDLFLTAGEGRAVRVDADRYRFYDMAEFVCLPGTQCADLETQIAAGARIEYRFAHAATVGDPLTVVSWEPCDGKLSGSGICTQ